MYELEVKLQVLIQWTKDTYGINTKEAMVSIERKLNELKQ